MYLKLHFYNGSRSILNHLMHEDARNVIDSFKGMSEADIITKLDTNGVQIEIAIENTLRDYNMGTIVRTANAFGIRTVHVIGRRQWNKRGAMMTDKYLRISYYNDFTDFEAYVAASGRRVVAVDNVAGALDITTVLKQPDDILLFGQEGPGLSDEALHISNTIVEIKQRGSTRSINVGVAAGIVMHEWCNH
jgi:tRNA G18 (ribose-2'-O)-methylase SpoU